MNTAGERLIEMRELKHLNQAKLAELISMAPSQLNKYEKNKNTFTFGFRSKLSSVFNEKELDYIQYGDNVPENRAISQSGNGNIQHVGNGGSYQTLTPYDKSNTEHQKIMQETLEQVKADDIAAIDKEILESLKYAPQAFKENILKKLEEFKKLSEL